MKLRMRKLPDFMLSDWCDFQRFPHKTFINDCASLHEIYILRSELFIRSVNTELQHKLVKKYSDKTISERKGCVPFKETTYHPFGPMIWQSACCEKAHTRTNFIFQTIHIKQIIRLFQMLFMELVQIRNYWKFRYLHKNCKPLDIYSNEWALFIKIFA